MDNTIYRLVGLLLICGLLVGDVHGWFEKCDNRIELRANEQRTIQIPDYCAARKPFDSSRFVIVAPQGFSISMNCNINLIRGSNGQCTDDYFYIARENNPSLSNAEYFCGNGNVQKTSKFNVAVIAHTSKASSATWGCTVRADCECGWSRSSKIVGGRIASVNEYTPMAGMVDLLSSTPFCGGTIISPNHVLSTAHCFLNTYSSPSRVGVLAGDHDYKVGSDTSFAAVYTVASITRHPSYNPNTDVNDIAVVRTNQPIQYNAGVAPACLPFQYSQTAFDRQVLEVPGWGTTSFGGVPSTTLRTVSLNAIPNSDCTARGMPNIGSGHICTYTPGKDACQYDSGGALYYRFNQLFAIGLVSYGKGCASNSPSVNTRISAYLPWIRSVCAGAYFCYQT